MQEGQCQDLSLEQEGFPMQALQEMTARVQQLEACVRQQLLHESSSKNRETENIQDHIRSHSMHL